MKLNFTLLSLLGTCLFLQAQQFEKVESELHNYFYASGDTGYFTNNDSKDILLCGAIDISGSGSANTTFCGLYQNKNGKYVYLDEYEFEYPTHLGDAQFLYDQASGKLNILHTGQSYENIIDYKLNQLSLNNNELNIVRSGEGKIYSQIAIADLNNDGQLDYAINGSSSAGGHDTTENVDFYQQLNGEFKHFWRLPGTQDRGIAFGDFNNDRRMDYIMLTADDQLDYYVQVNGRFEKKVSYPTLTSSTLATADFNADGFMDIVVSGEDHNEENKIQIFWNNGDHTFRIEELSNVGTTTNSSARNIAVGDLNNDGYYDIILVGEHNGDEATQILTYNSSTKTFDHLQTPSGLTNVGGPSNVQLIDIDHNNSLDVLITGFSYVDGEYTSTTGLYKNVETTQNEAPTPPTELKLDRNQQTFNFTWSGANDDKTPKAALQYELMVGSESGKADLAKYIVTTPSWTITNEQFPETIYWSVKSIDASKVYSEASKENVLALNEIGFEKKSIGIYPNPAKDVFHVQGVDVEHIEVYNSAGAKMPIEYAKGKAIHIAHLPKGIYIIKLVTKTNSTTQKLIIH